MLFLQRASRTCCQRTANWTRIYHTTNVLRTDTVTSDAPAKPRRKRTVIKKKYTELPEPPSVASLPLENWNGGLKGSPIVDSRATSSSHTCALFVTSGV